MNKLIIVLWILFALYVLVFMSILADLWSGVRKAKKRNIARTSYGFRQTVRKLAKYYNALLALTIIDAMQITAIWYLDTYYKYEIPILPIITFIGAIGFALIEVKSIFEKAEDKDKAQYENVGRLIEKIIVKREDWEEVSKVIGDYMRTKEQKK